MFEITTKPLETENFTMYLVNPKAGAYVSFQGWVRDENEGQEVTLLEYEAYPEMTLFEGQRILNEAKSKFTILEAHSVHRIGTLEVEDVAVWIGVTAMHRREAFAACEYIIDEIKKRLPIWKKEHYASGQSGWINQDGVPRAEPDMGH